MQLHKRFERYKLAFLLMMGLPQVLFNPQD